MAGPDVELVIWVLLEEIGRRGTSTLNLHLHILQFLGEIRDRFRVGIQVLPNHGHFFVRLGCLLPESLRTRVRLVNFLHCSLLLFLLLRAHLFRNIGFDCWNYITYHNLIAWHQFLYSFATFRLLINLLPVRIFFRFHLNRDWDFWAVVKLIHLKFRVLTRSKLAPRLILFGVESCNVLRDDLPWASSAIILRELDSEFVDRLVYLLIGRDPRVVENLLNPLEVKPSGWRSVSKDFGLTLLFNVHFRNFVLEVVM